MTKNSLIILNYLKADYNKGLNLSTLVVYFMGIPINKAYFDVEVSKKFTTEIF